MDAEAQNGKVPSLGRPCGNALGHFVPFYKLTFCYNKILHRRATSDRGQTGVSWEFITPQKTPPKTFYVTANDDPGTSAQAPLPHPQVLTVQGTDLH